MGENLIMNHYLGTTCNNNAKSRHTNYFRNCIWKVFVKILLPLFCFLFICSFVCFLKDLILFIYFREEKGGRKRGRETSMCGCLSDGPYRGSGPQPRHMSWLGIELATLWFVDLCSVHWTTPARTCCLYFGLNKLLLGFADQNKFLRVKKFFYLCL